MFENKKRLLVSSGEDDMSILSLLREKSADDWREHEPEGRLAVDVSQTDSELIIIATMAGAEARDIEVHLHNDLLTIRGARHDPTPPEAGRFYEECFWGRFSRTIVLPVDVKAELVQAQYRNGVLTVRLPKAGAPADIPIMVVED